MAHPLIRGPTRRPPQIIDELLQDRFFDKQFRALAVDFNLYNDDTNLVTVSRFVVELLPTGLMLQSYWINSIKMVLYEGLLDKLRVGGEVIIVIGTLLYLAKEIKQLRAAPQWFKYFADPANVFDLTLQALILVCLIYYISYITEPRVLSFSPGAACSATTVATPNAFGDPTCFVDLFTLARTFTYTTTFAGSLGLLMCLKFFKYFQLSRRMNALWLTLARAGGALGVFVFGFSLLVAGFAFMGQMCFGNLVADFHTFESSFSTLLRYPLGDFNYKALAQARPDVAPAFFVLYMALVFLVSMNMVCPLLWPTVHCSLPPASCARVPQRRWSPSSPSPLRR